MPMDPSKRVPYWHCLKHDIKFYSEAEFYKHLETDEEHIKERAAKLKND